MKSPCSSRRGFSFLLPEQKKRNKENSPSALFGLLRQVFPLNKKNSLRSNSFLFFTLQHSPPLHAQKVRPDISAFFYATSLRSLGCGVFFHCFARWGVMLSFLLRLFYLSSRVEQSVVKDLVYIHITSEAMCPPRRLLRPQWRSVKKNRVFSVKNEKLFERSEFFSFRKICGFFSSGA